MTGPAHSRWPILNVGTAVASPRPSSSRATHRTQIARASVFALAGWLALSSCRRSDVREWTPADHDQPPQPPARTIPPQDNAEQPNLAEVSWAANCLRCHGPGGAGDGPEGPMVRAPDLTRAEWQASVTDAELSATIHKGRGRMPAFDLPPTLIAALVQRIRAHKTAR